MTDKIAKRGGAGIISMEVDGPPDWVTEGTEGFEGLDSKDLVLPRLQICQALSPQRQKDSPKYIQGLEEGDFFNSVTKEVYGPGPHILTPLLCTKSRLKFLGKSVDSGVDCIGVPCDKSKENPEGIACRKNMGGPCMHPGLDEPVPCFLVYNFPVLLHAHPQSPVVLSFKSTGVRIAKGWLSMMRMRGKYPMYTMAFALTSVSAKNPKGSFMQARLDNAGWTPKDAVQAFASAYEGIKEKVILTDAETEREPGEEEGAIETEAI